VANAPADRKESRVASGTQGVIQEHFLFSRKPNHLIKLLT
jgi:hypothetical protein